MPYSVKMSLVQLFQLGLLVVCPVLRSCTIPAPFTSEWFSNLQDKLMVKACDLKSDLDWKCGCHLLAE
jgi:hypothetical protein